MHSLITSIWMGTVKMWLKKNAFIKVRHLTMIMHGTSLAGTFRFLDNIWQTPSSFFEFKFLVKIYAWQLFTIRAFINKLPILIGL